MGKKRILILLFLIGIIGGVFSQKTDVVILNNGDRITGEIKKLDLEILQFKTSAMSTAQIKWHHVSNIYAPDKYCQIELKDKTLIFGNLDSIFIPNALKVTSELGDFNVPTSSVVKITQVKKVFWGRFSGNLGAGLSYTKASEVYQYNTNAYISYIDEKHLAAIDVSSIETSQPDQRTAKKDALVNFNKQTFTRQFATVYTGANQNTELGIDLRSKAGLGYGVSLIHTNIARLLVIGGALVNQEKTLEEQDITQNGEGLFAVDARIFKYSDPEIYLNSTFNWYPSLTIPGRHRTDINIKLRFELLNNLFFEFTFYHNYDTKPASESAANTDYGLIGSFQYTFGL